MKKILCFLLIIVTLFLIACSNSEPEQKPEQKLLPAIFISFDKDVIKSNEQVNAYVTVTNLEDSILEGNISLNAIKGSDMVSISTKEDLYINLATKGSKVIKVFTITSEASVTVEPQFKATLLKNNGMSYVSAQSKTLRIEVK